MPGENSIFVSYRRSDSNDITGRIYDRLKEHFGPNVVFKDVDSIPYGDDFRSLLNRTVGNCQVLVAVIGPAWVDVLQERLAKPERIDWVRSEIETALAKEPSIPVIPLLVGGTKMPKEKDLPPNLQALAARNAAQARVDPDFHHDMDRLIRRLEEVVGQPDVVPKGRLQQSNNLLKALGESQLSVVKRRVLERRLNSFMSQYEALSEQYDDSLDAEQKTVIKRRLDKLEKELEEIESDISNL
jgi:hypothetical protein